MCCAGYGCARTTGRAIADFSAALEIDPRLAQAYTFRGLAPGRQCAGRHRRLRRCPAPPGERRRHRFCCAAFAWHQAGDLDRATADFFHRHPARSPGAEAYARRGAARRDREKSTPPSPISTARYGSTRASPRPTSTAAAWWDHKGDLDRALSDYDTTLRLDPLRRRPYQSRHRAGPAGRPRRRHRRNLRRRSQSTRGTPTPTSIGASPSKKATSTPPSAISASPSGLQATLSPLPPGSGLGQRGDLERAMADFDSAIRLNPATPSPISAAAPVAAPGDRTGPAPTSTPPSASARKAGRAIRRESFSADTAGFLRFP